MNARHTILALVSLQLFVLSLATSAPSGSSERSREDSMRHKRQGPARKVKLQERRGNYREYDIILKGSMREMIPGDAT